MVPSPSSQPTIHYLKRDEQDDLEYDDDGMNVLIPISLMFCPIIALILGLCSCKSINENLEEN